MKNTPLHVFSQCVSVSKKFLLIAFSFLSMTLVNFQYAKAIPIAPGFTPIADAGLDQNADEGMMVYLNGLGSFVYDQNHITYSWSQVSGPLVNLKGSSTDRPYFTAPQITGPSAQLGFELIVSDGAYFSDSATVYVQVAHINQSPIANAGGDQSVSSGDLIFLSGKQSFDPEGDPLTYSWRQTSGPTVSLDLTDPAAPRFVAPTAGANGGLLTFSLTVCDGYLLSNTATVSFAINNPNHAPIANPGLAFSAPERTIVYLNASLSSDPDGNPLSYKWTQLDGPPVILLLDTTAAPSFISPEVTASGALLKFQLQVSDGSLISAPSSISVYITDINRPPIAISGINQTVEERSLVTLDGTGSFDPDGDTLDYKWQQISGTPVSLSLTNVANPSFIAPEVPPGTTASLGFILTVSDGSLTAASQAVSIILTDVNRSPIADAGTDLSANMLTTVTLDASASFDFDGDNITYQWTQIGGPPITLNTVNPIHPTFIAPKVPTDGASISLSLVVNDGKLGSDPAFVNINVKNVNHAPIPSAGPNQVVSEESTVSLDGTDSYDPDGDDITFLWTQTSGPLTPLVNATSPSPHFTAPAISTATQDLSFKLTTSDGRLSASSNVTITLQNVNHAPIANAGRPQTIWSKSIATLDGSGSIDKDGDTLLYIWNQISGPTATMDYTDAVHPRLIAPDITSTTDLVFSLTVSDGYLLSPSSNVTISVKPTSSPPLCNKASLEDSVLWPPDHRMQEIEIHGIFGKDHEDDAGNKIVYTSLSQDEPTNGLGDGDTPIDGIIKSQSVLIRRERQGMGTGRTYTINFTATNSSGASCTGSVKLCVPKAANNKSCAPKNTQYNCLK